MAHRRTAVVVLALPDEEQRVLRPEADLPVAPPRRSIRVARALALPVKERRAHRVASVHSKVLVVDATTVVTGSANWSENAWSNNENSLWIADSSVAGAYVAEFERVFLSAPPVAPVSP